MIDYMLETKNLTKQFGKLFSLIIL
nr:truncated ABC transporter ATP-binding protein MutF [Streptococcus mutans]